MGVVRVTVSGGNLIREAPLSFSLENEKAIQQLRVDREGKVLPCVTSAKVEHFLPSKNPTACLTDSYCTGTG